MINNNISLEKSNGYFLPIYCAIIHNKYDIVKFLFNKLNIQKKIYDNLFGIAIINMKSKTDGRIILEILKNNPIIAQNDLFILARNCHYHPVYDEIINTSVKININAVDSYGNNMMDILLYNMSNLHDEKLAKCVKYLSTKLKPNKNYEKSNLFIAYLLGDIDIEHENKLIDCSICCEDNQLSVQLTPCHHTLCIDCSLKLQQCPYCQVPIFHYEFVKY